MMKFEKQVFVIDAWDGEFEGFTVKHYWNGWACPYFPKDVADRLLELINNDGFNDAWYNETADAYYVKPEGGYDDEVEEFTGQVIECDGEKHKVYAIGAWSWTWEHKE